MKKYATPFLPLQNNLIANIRSSMHVRDFVYFRNVIQTFATFIFSSLINLLIISIIIRFFDKNQYGLWLTISSIFTWFSLLNFGIDAGFRNKLTISLSQSDFKTSKIYVSTTYCYFSILSVMILIIFITLSQFINWGKFLNSPISIYNEVTVTIYLFAIYFAMKITLSLINKILEADQRIGISNIYPLLTKGLVTITLFVCYKYSSPSLILLAVIMIFPDLMVSLITTLFYFSKRYKHIAPSIRNISFLHGKLLISFGSRFLMIQITMMIVFSTNNILLSKLFNPEQVTIYNIALGFMLVFATIFNMILAPSNTAFTQAHINQDIQWIEKTHKRFFYSWVILVICITIAVIFSPYIYSTWLGNNITIPISTSIFAAIYVILQCWNFLFSQYINSLGKVKLITIISIPIMIINIPLCILLARYSNLGPNSIFLASILCFLPGAIFTPIQTYLIIKNKASGIWNN